MTSDNRKLLLTEWLQDVLGTTDFSCELVPSDASFRRYFRVKFDDQSFVVMDAPPTKEDCTSFIAIAKLLYKLGVNAPQIFHQSLEKGFLVLSDLGSMSYLEQLNDTTAHQYYDDAIKALHKMHDLSLDDIELPQYNLALLKQEMGLFEQWFIEALLDVDLSKDDKKVISDIQNKLAESALEQPQVFVHRDYHSRNLMVTKENNPGVIDFQDAVAGPITYDLVSLYRDCYIEWPNEQIYAWLGDFLNQRKNRACEDDFDSACFYQWFDWMGVQRHMKAIGIFSRLLLRDGKEGYLKDVPRTLGYVYAVCVRYDELAPLAELIKKHQLMDKLGQLSVRREQ